MGRFDNIFKQLEPVEQGDSAIFPASPRNAIADMLPDSWSPYVSESLADQKNWAQDFPEQVAGSTTAITRAEKMFGEIGKDVNKFAAKITDKSPQADHLRNLPMLRKFLEEKGNTQIDQGSSAKIHHTPDMGNKIIKTQAGSPEKAMREQMMLNKLEDLTPKTNTYVTSKANYQVQDKVKPLRNTIYDEYTNTPEWLKIHDNYISDVDAMGELIKKRGINPLDSSVNNSYLDPITKTIKTYDVGQFKDLSSKYDPNGTFNLDDILQLNNTLKKPANMVVNPPTMIKDKLFKEAIQSDVPNYINEILRIKQGGK